jgi:hypothetical protein
MIIANFYFLRATVASETGFPSSATTRILALPRKGFSSQANQIYTRVTVRTSHIFHVTCTLYLMQVTVLGSTRALVISGTYLTRGRPLVSSQFLYSIEQSTKHVLLHFVRAITKGTWILKSKALKLLRCDGSGLQVCCDISFDVDQDISRVEQERDGKIKNCTHSTKNSESFGLSKAAIAQTASHDSFVTDTAGKRGTA